MTHEQKQKINAARKAVTSPAALLMPKPLREAIAGLIDVVEQLAEAGGRDAKGEG